MSLPLTSFPSQPHVPDSYRVLRVALAGLPRNRLSWHLRKRAARLPFPMNIIDLRQTTVRQLEPLLLEEARHWQDELHWDYRSALDLIKRFLEAHALAGCVAFEHGIAAGYAFYVLEDHKGLIGGLYVSPSYDQEPIGRRLLDEMLFSMRALPQLHRIEAQLMPFGGPVEDALRDQGFRLYTRQFMLFDLLKKSDTASSINSGLRLERWNDRYFDACAKLIFLAYANHVDGDINDQYRSRYGALKFLKNIILLPGCGQFVPNASFVLRHPGSEDLAGAVLTSEVSPGVGHTTQICVMPGFQGNGLGRLLMLTAAEALRTLKFTELTLTVTRRIAPPSISTNASASPPSNPSPLASGRAEAASYQ